MLPVVTIEWKETIILALPAVSEEFLLYLRELRHHIKATNLNVN